MRDVESGMKGCTIKVTRRIVSASTHSTWSRRTGSVFARAHGADRIVTTAGTDPRVEAICQTLEQQLPVQVLAVEPFVQLEGPADLGRFSRYWRRAEREVWAGWGQEG